MTLSFTRVLLRLTNTSLAASFHCSKCVEKRFIHSSLPLKFSFLSSSNDRNNSRLLKAQEVDYALQRQYAKGKDKKRSDKGVKKAVTVDDTALNEIVDIEKLRNQMQKHVDELQADYIKNLSLRSTSGAIESLKVKFEGKDYKLQELAQVIRQNPKSIILNMASFPQAIPAVLLAISKSGMNLNTQQDGTKLFIPVPKVTKELREQLAKNAKALFIKCKDNIKDVQNKYIKSVKSKEKTGLSQDMSHSISDQISSVCDTYVAQAEKILTMKENELKGN